ncbi:Uma2 family endonuclease [Alkalihalobacterium bogoriense]|uniref:Uma2 family endonuclease n=1 Tax=Alkalihalobacterium bogoriense TaxID=246272 RepID=UPI000685191B|nr:Uma2 family endonuclease [Alkalihalobacterium bogoriense]
MKKTRSNHPDKHKVEEDHSSYDEPFERYEIINNIRYDLKPSPSVVHQVIVTGLNQSLSLNCPSEGIVIVAPMDVHLDENNTVQPDLIFIRNENFHIIKNERIEGTADLLVEILSPSSGSHDRIKLHSYCTSNRVITYLVTLKLFTVYIDLFKHRLHLSH